jgi:cysteine desulfurase
MTRIYLDYNASTPIDPAVAAAMRPFLDEAFGNPSSDHWASTPARAALEDARGQVAELLGCAPDEVVFTSGGSEANNLALKGTFFALRDKGDHISPTLPSIPLSLLRAASWSGWARRSRICRLTGRAGSIPRPCAGPSHPAPS